LVSTPLRARAVPQCHTVHRHAEQNKNDRIHDHQFDQRKSFLRLPFALISITIPNGPPVGALSRELNTHRHILPHQLVESGSSDTHRLPNPFDSSSGPSESRAGNRTFFPTRATFTPVTSVSKSGG